MVHTLINIPIIFPCFPFPFSLFIMTRLIIFCPPGGVSGVQRRHYTAREKIAIISQICHVQQDTSISYWAAAESISISHTLVICWHTLHKR